MEWTMAACNLAIGATLMLGGSGGFSVDSALLTRRLALAERGWFRWIPALCRFRSRRALSRNLHSPCLRRQWPSMSPPTIIMGSVITPFHGGPVSPSKHHLDLTDGVVLPNGAVRFYLDGGTPEEPSNVMTAVLKSSDGSVHEQWDGTALSHLPASAIINEFAYNRFAPGSFRATGKSGITL
jgi:thiosulfate dehydrogenase (quinone)